MTSTSLLIDGLDYPVLLTRHRRAKRFTMRLDKNGHVKVTTPWRFSKRNVISFIRDHQDWIQKQQEAEKSTPFHDGMIVPIEGVDHVITHIEGKGIKVTQEDGQLIVAGNIDRLPRAVERYLRKRAREIIVPLAHEKASTIGKKINRIAIKDTSTRWGSCSTKGNLNFSWRVIMAPPETLDYLVAHEVAHLQHMNHSHNFWDVCEGLSEAYSVGKSWLKKNGKMLQGFG